MRGAWKHIGAALNHDSKVFFSWFSFFPNLDFELLMGLYGFMGFFGASWIIYGFFFLQYFGFKLIWKASCFNIYRCSKRQHRIRIWVPKFLLWWIYGAYGCSQEEDTFSLLTSFSFQWVIYQSGFVGLNLGSVQLCLGFWVLELKFKGSGYSFVLILLITNSLRLVPQKKKLEGFFFSLNLWIVITFCVLNY